MSATDDQLLEIIHGVEALSSMTIEQGKPLYRRWARMLHPDTRVTAFDPSVADRLYAQLDAAWQKLVNPTPVKPWVLATKKHDYSVGRLLRKSEIVNEYEVTWGDGVGLRKGILRLPRSPKNNDLVDAEIQALKKLAISKDASVYSAYFPTLIESIKHRDSKTKTERKGLVITFQAENLLTLTEVMAKVDLDPKDIAWMFRRLLVGLGAAHQEGIVNAGVSPDAVLIEPEQHGVILANWQFSSTGSPVKAMVKNWKQAYPPEILTKESPVAASDIYMAARLHQHLMAMDASKDAKQLRIFLDGCCTKSQRSRPQDAWKLLDEYTELIERLWGPRRFRPLTIPA